MANECEYCVDGMQAAGETPCPQCTRSGTLIGEGTTRPAAPVEGLEIWKFHAPLNGAAKMIQSDTGEWVHRSQAEAIIAAERAAIPILKGTAFRSGDGWKETTKEGDICFVWNKMHPAPYAPGQYPRVGKEHWSASTESFTFEPASPDEVAKLFSDQNDEICRWHKKAMDAGVIVHTDGTTSHPMRKERDDLKADNAALTARVKELDDECNDLVKRNNEAVATIDNWINSCAASDEKVEALETQLTAARKALTEIDNLDQAMGHELKLDDAFDAVRIARAALEVKP